MNNIRKPVKNSQDNIKRWEQEHLETLNIVKRLERQLGVRSNYFIRNTIEIRESYYRNLRYLYFVERQIDKEREILKEIQLG